MEATKPKWAADHGLTLCGQYFQAFVEDYEAVLSHLRIDTVSSYGVRRSRQNASGSSACENHLDEKENMEVHDTTSPSNKV